MENIKVSIIMPVYKVEQYVGKAIESIQAQSLKEFEFLIVDDGTPDKSGEICDRYAEYDPRIKVIHKENGGAPSARNTAMDIARGEYLYFMDSDDWAEPGMLADMYHLAKKTQAQLVVSGFFIDTYYNQTQCLTIDYVPEAGVYPEKEQFRKAAYRLFDKNMLYQPWNKLFLREYIENKKIRFPKTFWDDFPFVLSVIKDVERVTVTSKQYYHFLRARAESETARYVPQMYEKREEEDRWMTALYASWGIDDLDSREMIARRYVERLVGCVENLTNPRSGLDKMQKRQKAQKMLQNPRVKEALAIAKPRSLYMKIMLLPMRWRSVTLMLWEAECITFVKQRNPQLFANLKARR